MGFCRRMNTLWQCEVGFGRIWQGVIQGAVGRACLALLQRPYCCQKVQGLEK